MKVRSSVKRMCEDCKVTVDIQSSRKLEHFR